ncbi:hypothetical protein MATL_G00251390 [Megalops atlanticus]|uniref:Uncharacterized protein n=1 Tax=Megalops atlanticus TaxID=7932 RepID=A0A9D3PD51_MEGAT|nr:hypothetical protein MATL_G00251390 [Megalops atlanticus]
MRRSQCNQQDHAGPHTKSQPSARLFDRIRRYRSHKKCEEQYIKFQACQAEREHLHTQQLQLQKGHVVDDR